MELVLLFFAVLLTVGAYGEYYRDTARAKVAPNRWSWLIWSATTGTEVATFQAVSGDFATSAVFIASVFACIAITLLVWRRACWRAPTRTELICVRRLPGGLRGLAGFPSAIGGRICSCWR